MKKKAKQNKSLKTILDTMTAREMLILMSKHIEKKDNVWTVLEKDKELSLKDTELVRNVILSIVELDNLRRELMSIKSQFWKLDKDHLENDSEEIDYEAEIEEIIKIAKKDQLLFVIRQFMELY